MIYWKCKWFGHLFVKEVIDHTARTRTTTQASFCIKCGLSKKEVKEMQE